MKLLHSAPGAGRFYDVNLRDGCWEPLLVRDLISQADVVKLNDEEVEEVARICGMRPGSLEESCRMCVRTFPCEGGCVARGVRGCALLLGGEYIEADGYAVKVTDTVRAFAAALLHGLGSAWPAPQIADFANHVGALVASRAGAIPSWTVSEVEALRHKSHSLERT